MASSPTRSEFPPTFEWLPSIRARVNIDNRESTDMTAPLRFAVFGAGFWTPYQLSGWREVGGVECVAIYNRTRHTR